MTREEEKLKINKSTRLKWTVYKGKRGIYYFDGSIMVPGVIHPDVVNL